MTQPAWPFSLVHSPSYPTNGVPTAAEINSLQTQVAVAADGRVWTDVAAVKNWSYTHITVPSVMSQQTLIRDPKSRRWLLFGGNTGTVTWTVAGDLWPINTGPGDLGQQIVQVTAAWANSAGIILAGGAPFAADTRKIRESTDGGATWATARNIGSSDTHTVNAITYSETLGLWFASVGINTDGIFSSADRVTWTLRSGLNSDTTNSFTVAESPTPIVIEWRSGNLSYLRSVDGITWTNETFPEGQRSRGCWSDAYGKFFMSGATGIWSSATGLTGSWTQIYAGTEQAALAAFGRLLVRGDGKASIDGGVTWFAVLEPTASGVPVKDCYVTATPFGVGVARGATGDVWISRQIGF